MLRKVLNREVGRFHMECGHVIRQRGSNSMPMAWCNPCQAGNMSREEAVIHLLMSEDIRVGTLRSHVLANLGMPDALHRTAPNYPVPMIWQYGDTYLMFPPSATFEAGLVCVVREDNDQPEFLLGFWPTDDLNPDQLRRAVEPFHHQTDADRNPDCPDARWADDGGCLVGCPD